MDEPIITWLKRFAYQDMLFTVDPAANRDGFYGNEWLDALITHAFPPYSEQEEAMFDFEELRREGLNGFMSSSAFLLTGGSGSGKHRADKIFGSEIRAMVKAGLEPGQKVKDVARFYYMDLEEAGAFTTRQKAEQLGIIFDEIQQMMRGVWATQENLLVYLSFGDVTDILNKKKHARYFLQQIRFMMAQSQVIFVCTALYEGKPSDLPDMVKKTMLVYEMEEPDVEKRKKIFEVLASDYPHIKLESDADKMAMITEDLTYGELVSLRAWLLLRAKQKAAENGMDLYGYVKVLSSWEGEDLLLTEQEIQWILEKIRRERYVPKVKMGAPVLAAGYPAVAPSAGAASLPPRQTKDQEAEDSTEMLEETIEKEPDTIDGFLNGFSKLEVAF